MNNEIEAKYLYNGIIRPEFLSRAIEAYNTYKSDKEALVTRIRDNERFYREAYMYTSSSLKKKMTCNTSFIFSAIENTRADAVENFPTPNILERDETGSETAALLTKIIPVQLEMSDFKRVYKENVRNKLKYGTAVYGVFYNEQKKNIDIRAIDILDIYVDMHMHDIQNSQFVFITAAIENDVLKKEYPNFRDLFTGDADIETLSQSYRLRDRTTVIDCYYKKANGAVHMMKLCNNTIIAATEDMEGYENGLYDHGKYPIVFDALYPSEHSPFGFSMIDIGKATQIQINKLDEAITENIKQNAKVRFLTKRNGGIDETEFRDNDRNIIHYEGETDAIRPVQGVSINEYFLNHREHKKDELKELLANRDFQQGSTSGGVTAASAIQTLQEAGEKRARAIIDDTNDSYIDIVKMTTELMRQFFDEDRSYRTTDDFGQKSFKHFSNKMMYTEVFSPETDRIEYEPIEFDFDVVTQRENPYTREKNNNTVMTLWTSGFFNDENLSKSLIALKSMNFDGKDKLIADIQNMIEEQTDRAAEQQMQQSQAYSQSAVSGPITPDSDDELVPINLQ